jgi:hypothetical protein
MDKKLLEVAKLGKYYNPTFSHYNSESGVTCDRCHMVDLKICIGYKDLDLCVRCVNIVTDLEHYNKTYLNGLLSDESSDNNEPNDNKTATKNAIEKMAQRTYSKKNHSLTVTVNDFKVDNYMR